MTDVKTWFIKTIFKVINTSAQTAIGVIGGAAVFSEVDWRLVGGSVALAAITTFLMHIGDLDVDAITENKQETTTATVGAGVDE